MSIDVIFAVLELCGVVLALAASIYAIIEGFGHKIRIKAAEKSCETLQKLVESPLMMELRQQIETATSRTAKALHEAEAAGEAVSAINAKLAARWREEEKRQRRGSRADRDQPPADPVDDAEAAQVPLFPITAAAGPKMRLVPKG